MTPDTINLLAFLASLYFTPLLLALGREHHHLLPIGLLNLLLGWTFIGWVVALVWAAMPVPPRVAP